MKVMSIGVDAYSLINNQNKKQAINNTTYTNSKIAPLAQDTVSFGSIENKFNKIMKEIVNAKTKGRIITKKTMQNYRLKIFKLFGSEPNINSRGFFTLKSYKKPDECIFTPEFTETQLLDPVKHILEDASFEGEITNVRYLDTIGGDLYISSPTFVNAGPLRSCKNIIINENTQQIKFPHLTNVDVLHLDQKIEKLPIFPNLHYADQIYFNPNAKADQIPTSFPVLDGVNYFEANKEVAINLLSTRLRTAAFNIFNPTP